MGQTRPTQRKQPRRPSARDSPARPVRKTSQQLVDEANALARVYYKSYGYEVEKGYRFDHASHPQERGMWNLAAIAYQMLLRVDIHEAARECDDDAME